jgi:hypothetical protein
MNAPIQVLDSVPATYPPAAVDAIHAPEEWSRGTAIKGGNSLTPNNQKSSLFQITAGLEMWLRTLASDSFFGTGLVLATSLMRVAIRSRRLISYQHMNTTDKLS